MVAGDCCYFPPDVPHVFTVTSDQPARLLVIYTPPYEESPDRVIRGFPTPPPPDAAPAGRGGRRSRPRHSTKETSHETIAPAARAAGAALLPTAAVRAADYPAKPITLIVPFPAVPAPTRSGASSATNSRPSSDSRSSSRTSLAPTPPSRPAWWRAPPRRLHDLRHHQHLALGRALADEERALRPREGLHAHRAAATCPSSWSPTPNGPGKRSPTWSPMRASAPAHHLCQRQQHRHRGRRHAGPPRPYRHPARAL